MAKVVIMDHPLIQHKIGLIRREETGTKDFRQTISEIAMLICYEATRDLKLDDVEITTPICKTTVKDGEILITRVKPAGKKEMNVKDFFNGFDSSKLKDIEVGD